MRKWRHSLSKGNLKAKEKVVQQKGRQRQMVQPHFKNDWQSSKALKFVTFTSVPFLLYALAFASGYEPLIQPLTPGSWDKASDAGQHIFSNFPLWCLHASCASLYICSTLLQFNFPGTLRRHASLHRVSGYVFLMCGGCLSVTGLVMAPRSEFPGFAAPCLALSVLWLGCGGMALWTIKRRLVTAHEKWVVRTMAAGYASILSRPAIAFVHFLTDSTYRDSGTPGLWLAMIVAMTSSELLLKHLELQVRSQELAVTESEGPTDRLAHAIDPQEVRTSK
ncbi:hypothetical protein KFL_004480080 [Klebsormidium nitens]|uniref:DUF2306 domain-containing protein n=1 Tax=Klebsormidium nitens TaxID=105231 RepID=A0A1Y1IHU8_KLENI|nr:hypothetical protein KFL_004480080 [Klebsormidium nitens]|eukprot:GAQ88651.1 hypothetical protein KFL_004480080 [Klebsormidium nitens]